MDDVRHDGSVICQFNVCLVVVPNIRNTSAILDEYQIARENMDNVAIAKEKVNKTCENRFKQSLILVLYTLIFNYD